MDTAKLINMAKLKFVHMPTERTPLLPIGMVALANLVKEYGFDVELIHYEFDPIDLSDADMLFFDLHWHDQSRVVIDKILEVNNPNTFIGGHMASCFKDEIEAKYPVKVIAGYAEEELIKILTDKDVKIDMNDLDYSSFDIMRSYKEYVKTGFHFSTGRGCSVNCSYCSGGKDMQKKIYGRNCFEFMKPNKVLSELRNAFSYGFRNWVCSFDPAPKSQYYIDLYKRIDFIEKAYFGCWGIPTKAFIDQYDKTFNDKSMSISPKTCIESIRSKHKGLSFSNKELIEIVDYIDTKDIKLKLWFTEMEDMDLIERLGTERCLQSIIIAEPFKIDSFMKYYYIHKFGITNTIRVRLTEEVYI